jgi:hypothetical protein
LLGRLRLFGRRRRVFRRRSFRLNVDDYFSRRFRRLRRLQINDRERRGVQRNDDGDDKRAKPGRTDGRRLEDPPVQRRDRHGLGAFGAGEVGAGAPGVGDSVWRGPETMAMREIPFAASSSMTDTTSP